MTWLYLLRERSEVFKCLQQFFNEIKTQFAAVLKIFRFDNAIKIISCTFQNFFDQGIIHETSYAHTPDQNGVSKRKHGHLEVARCLLHNMPIPKFYWREALQTAC